MSIVIKEVVGKKDLKKWVDFPNKLYKKVPAYVPFLFNDEMDTFTKAKNPAYDFCETKLFLAYIDNKRWKEWQYAHCCGELSKIFCTFAETFFWNTKK